MSTEYALTKDISLVEASCKVSFCIYDERSDTVQSSEELSARELRKAIIEAIKVLSYISNEGQDVLDRFNVSYYDKD